MFRTIFLLVLFFLFPGIFCYKKNLDFYYNIILIFSCSIIFNYILGIVYLAFAFNSITLYIGTLYLSIFILHLFNKNLFYIYYHSYKKINNLINSIIHFQRKQISLKLNASKIKIKLLHYIKNKYYHIIIFIFCFIVFYHSIFFPSTSADAISIHMPLIKLLYETNSFPRIKNFPFLNKHYFYDISPFHIVGFMAFKLQKGDMLIRFLNPILLLLALISFIGSFRNLKLSNNVPIYSLISFVSCPAILAVSSTMNNDISYLSFFLISIYFLTFSASYTREIDSFLGDIFIGLMISSKQFAFINLSIYLGLRFYLNFNYRRDKKIKFSYYLSPIVILIFGSLKYLITYINFKDPFYPYSDLILKNSEQKNSFFVFFIIILFFAVMVSSFLTNHAKLIMKIFDSNLFYKISSFILSGLNLVGLVYYFYRIISRVEYRLHSLSIITLDKISHQNQPLGPLVISFSLIWMISTLGSRKLEKKLLTFYVILNLLLLFPFFLSSSISRYYLNVLPVIAFMSGDSIDKLIDEINSINIRFNFLISQKFVKHSLKYSVLFFINLNIFFGISVGIFGFKTINEPIYYPILHPFNNDQIDLEHWKDFEIQMINFINDRLPKYEYIVVYPFDIYLLTNYSRLIYPESSAFVAILKNEDKSNWFKILREKYNIKYIAVLNSVAFDFFNAPKEVKEFFDLIQFSSSVYEIKKYMDTRVVKTKSNLFSVLYYIS